MNDISIFDEIRAKRLAILEDTAKHYTSKNRCQIGIRCKYTPIPNVSEGCAIGRLVDAETAKNLDAMNYPINNSVSFKLLPDNLKVLGGDFLLNLQRLHDNGEFWNEEGLSERGKIEYEDLVKRYTK